MVPDKECFCVCVLCLSLNVDTVHQFVAIERIKRVKATPFFYMLFTFFVFASSCSLVCVLVIVLAVCRNQY